MAEYSSTGSQLKRYAYLPDQYAPIQMQDANGIYDVHSDHLDTPKFLTNAAKQVVWKANYESFGKATVNEDVDGDTNLVNFNVRFPGQYFDTETGLHYNYFRYYDPSTGRYLSSDPIGLRGRLNAYQYAGGNPNKLIDPFGLLEFSINVDTQTSINLINRINDLAKKGGGTIKVPELLNVLNFPPDVAKRINDARGNVILQCPTPNEGGFSNTGEQINENIPGTFGALALKLSDNVTGDIRLNKKQNHIG